MTITHVKIKNWKNWKKPFLDINSRNIYARLQVSRFNSVVRIDYRYKQEYILANKRTPTDFTETYGLCFESNLDCGDW